MPRKPLIVIPIEAPVQREAFDLFVTLDDCLRASGQTLVEGDVLAVSSKYAAIAEGRIDKLESITVSAEAEALAHRYNMNPRMAQLVLQEADHIFGGIQGFLLTHKDGIISPNAGLDRSNVPAGHVVPFPEKPFETAAALCRHLREVHGVRAGVILTDSWLMPGRWGTTGVALAAAGFQPLQDERGKADLFGNPMQVTQRGIADTICAAAQLVMGERDEATPFAIVRNAEITLSDAPVTVDDVAIPWELCIYVESLTDGRLATAAVNGALSAPVGGSGT